MNSILRWCFKLQQSVAKTMRRIRGISHDDGEAQYSEELGPFLQPSKKRAAISVGCSFLWVDNLHMMVVEQISRRMVYLSDGHLEIDL